MKRSEKIQRYLDGELSESEAQSFREELLADPGLREELELYQLIDESLKKRDEIKFRRKLRSAYSQYELSRELLNTSRRKIRLRVISIISSLAALLIIAIFLFTPGRSYSAEEVFNEYFSPIKVDLSIRSSSSHSSRSLLAEGVGLYTNKKYDQAAGCFVEYLKNSPDDSITPVFYLGLCLLESDNSDEAKRNFTQVLNADFNYYQEHALWYLALAYLKEKNIPEARKIFESIVRENTFYSERSSEILQKISKIKL